MNGWAIAGTAFLACAVEGVEALTIVLAVGLARGWRQALSGAAWAVAALAAIVAVARPLLQWLEPLPAFHIVVGAAAIYLGYGWLRKAVERAAGTRALRDEAAAFEHHHASLKDADGRAAFVAAFNGTFIEGTEVVFIVLAIGASAAGALSWAAFGGLGALAVVVIVGAALRAPLQHVPENLMKFVVGVLLTTFGIFWVGEGLGIAWWHDDIAVLYLGALVLAAALGTVAVLRRTSKRTEHV